MIDIMVDLEGNPKVPLYEKIYEYIRQDMMDGKILEGEKLPSTRLLAKNLSVSRSTVDLAYGQLMAEGYIQAQPYRGYFACDITELYRSGEKPDRNGAGAAKTEVCSENLIDFSPYGIDSESFPFRVWRKISRAVLIDDREELLYAKDGQGEQDLREAIASYLHQARGVNCESSDIIVGAGNEYLEILLTQILGAGKTVLMDNPGYPQAYHTFSNMGYQVVTGNFAQNLADDELLTDKSPDLVYLMPSHQFPLGNVLSLKQRIALLKWSYAKEGRYLIEDDHDSEYRYRGKPIPSMQSIDREGKVIYLGTFSKSIAPSLRVSYMVLPPHLTEQYRRDCGFYSVTVPKIQQEILCTFLKEGYFERHLNKMRGIYRCKRDFLLGELKKYDWAKCISGDQAGLHVLVHLQSELDEEELCSRLACAGVRAFGIYEYRLDRKAEKAFDMPVLLLGYGRPGETEMRRGLLILDKIIRNATLQ